MTEQIYAFIRQYIDIHQMSPTLREIAMGCYLSAPSVMRHLDKLEGQGKLTRDPYRPRSIRLIHPSDLR
jgi:SOS-response transcriptional repressor LexA